MYGGQVCNAWQHRKIIHETPAFLADKNRWFGPHHRGILGLHSVERITGRIPATIENRGAYRLSMLPIAREDSAVIENINCRGGADHATPRIKGADALERRPQLKAALAARKYRWCVGVTKPDRLGRDVTHLRLMAHKVSRPAPGRRPRRGAVRSSPRTLVSIRRPPRLAVSLWVFVRSII